MATNSRMMYTATTCHQQNGHTSSRINGLHNLTKSCSLWYPRSQKQSQPMSSCFVKASAPLVIENSGSNSCTNKWCHTPGGKYLLNKCHVSHSEVRLAVYGGSVMYSEMLPVEDNTLLTELCMSSPGDCHNKFN